MTDIRQQSQLLNRTTSVGSQVILEYTANEDSFISDSQEVTTTPAALDIGTIQTPRYYQLRLLSGDNVEVSLDGGSTYPLALSEEGDTMLIRPNFEASREISTVVAEADVAGSTGGDYFDLADYDGPVRVWFNSGADSAPSVPVGGRLVEVTFVQDSDAATMATAIVTAFSGDVGLSAEASTATVTITDKFTGTRTNIADGTTGWASFTTTQEGAAAAEVYIKSAGDSQLLATIAPN